MTVHTVSMRQVRDFRLRAQHLAAGASGEDLASAAGVCGVQDTPPGNAAVGLGLRVPDATPEQIAAAIDNDRDLVVVWSRRGSPHLVPSADLLVFTRGLEPDTEDGWATFITGFAPHLDGIGMSATEVVDTVTDATVEVLDGQVLTKRELGEALRPHLPEPLARWFDADTYSSFSALVSRGVALKGVLVMAPRTGNSASFVRADQWLGDRPRELDRDEARATLVRRYLHAYGPSTAEAFADWGGITAEQAQRSFALVAEDTRLVRIEDHPSAPDGDRLALADDIDALTGDDGDPGVTLVPAYDTYLSAVDRETICPDIDDHRSLWRSSHNPGAVLVGGAIAGTWKGRKKGGRLEVSVDPWKLLDDHATEVIGAQADRVAALRGCPEADLRINS